MKKIDINFKLNDFHNKISKKLSSLNKIFIDNGYELFIVGGFIRDYLLGIKTDDIDICSSATPEELEKILTNTEYSYTIINKRLGTYKIFTKDSKESYEYTCFRMEKYDYGHCPSKVEFSNSIDVDAQRRDFSINCIYYSIENQKFFDPCNGIKDCENRELRMINNQVFDSDGLRIMRMIRFAYTKNLDIEDKTYQKAKMQSYLLGEIAHERIAKEMRDIFDFNLKEDKKLEQQFLAIDVLHCIFDLNILHYIFLELPRYVDIEQFYEFAIVSDEMCGLAEFNIFYALIYILVLNIEDMMRMEIPPEFYMDMLSTKGLMLIKPMATKYRVIIDALVTLNKMVDKSLFINYIQLFYPFIDEIIEARIHLSGMVMDETLARLVNTNKLMQANGIPRCYEELDVKPVDLIERWKNLPREQIGTLLDCALIIATKSGRNEKEFLISELEKIISKGGKLKRW